MPKEAVKRGAVERTIPLGAIAREIMNYSAWSALALSPVSH
jgi:hypothetical protein